MSIEGCQNFRRVFPVQNRSTRFEVAFCSAPPARGSDMNCGGMSSHCPEKLRKYFNPSRDIPLEQVTFGNDIPVGDMVYLNNDTPAFTGKINNHRSGRLPKNSTS